MASLEHDHGFEPGMIRRIKLNNFLTYREVEMYAGPRHNLVLGPNGTGKSSLLCAIGLGLGGRPKILGRAEGLGQFILHGESTAHIEIVLQDVDPERVFVIKRSFDSNSKRASKWYTRVGHVTELERGAAESKNFTQSTEDKVCQKVAELGIDVNNLTCFMPQERVGEFSGIDTQELLVNTLRVLETKANSQGSTPHGEHQALIDMQKEIESLSMEESTIQRDLDRMKCELDRLQRDVDRQVERKALVDEADVHQKLLLWMHFDSLRAEGKALQEKLKELKRQEDEERQKIEPLEKHFHALDERLAAVNAKRKRAESKKVRMLEACENEKKALTNLDTSMAMTKDRLQSMDSERKRDEQRIVELGKRIQDLQSQIDAIDIPATEAALMGASDEQKAIQGKIRALTEEKDRAENASNDLKDRADNVKRELAEITNSRKRMMQRIPSKYGSRGDACLRGAQIIDEMRRGNQFRGEVYGPLIAEMNASNKTYAAAVEDYIGGNAPLTFVVSERHDYDLIRRVVVRERGVKVYLSQVDGEREDDQHAIRENAMRRFRSEADILVRGDQAFDAPRLVKKYLCAFNGLDKMLIGSSRTEECIDAFLKNHLQQLGGVTVYTQPAPGQLRKHRGDWSRQGNCVVNSTQDCRPGGMLGSANDERAEALRRELEELTADADRVHKEYQAVSSKVEDLKRRRAEITAEEKRLRVVRSQPKVLGKKKASYEAKRAELQRKVLESTDAARQALVKDLQAMAQENCERLQSIQKHIKELAEHHVPFLQSELVVFLVDRAKQQKEDELKIAGQQIQVISKAVSAAEKDFKEKKGTARSYKKMLAKEAPITETVTDENGNQLERDTPLRAKLNELEKKYNDDQDLVKDGLDEIQQKLSSIQENEDVFAQFEELQKKYEERQMQSQRREEIQKEKEEKLYTRIEKHRCFLSALVALTSDAFARYMDELGYTNCKVELFSEGLVAKWELHIKVRFRDSQKDPETLSAHIHSGGERAVSTIMFLMALQHLVSSPFRIVDEINQGKARKCR